MTSSVVVAMAVGGAVVMTSSVVIAMVVGRAVVMTSSVVVPMDVGGLFSIEIFTGICVFADRLTKPLLYDTLLKPNTRARLLVSTAHIVETFPFLMLLGDQLVVLCGKKILTF